MSVDVRMFRRTHLEHLSGLQDDLELSISALALIMRAMVRLAGMLHVPVTRRGGRTCKECFQFCRRDGRTQDLSSLKRIRYLIDRVWGI